MDLYEAGSLGNLGPYMQEEPILSWDDVGPGPGPGPGRGHACLGFRIQAACQRSTRLYVCCADIRGSSALLPIQRSPGERKDLCKKRGRQMTLLMLLMMLVGCQAAQPHSRLLQQCCLFDFLGWQVGIPLGAGLVSMFVRRDVVQAHNITIPNTWEELVELALAWNGTLDLNKDGELGMVAFSLIAARGLRLLPLAHVYMVHEQASTCPCAPLCRRP